MSKQPWELGYKPPTAVEAFDPQRPLPDELVAGIARDWSHQERSNRAEGLEEALEEIIRRVVREGSDPAGLRPLAVAALKEFRR